MCRQSYFCLLDDVECTTRHIFYRRVWYRVLSLCYACILSFGIIHAPYTAFVQSFISFVASVAELDRGKNCVLNQSITHSPSLFDAPKDFGRSHTSAKANDHPKLGIFIVIH